NDLEDFGVGVVVIGFEKVLAAPFSSKYDEILKDAKQVVLGKASIPEYEADLKLPDGKPHFMVFADVLRRHEHTGRLQAEGADEAEVKAVYEMVRLVEEQLGDLLGKDKEANLAAARAALRR